MDFAHQVSLRGQGSVDDVSRVPLEDFELQAAPRTIGRTTAAQQVQWLFTGRLAATAIRIAGLTGLQRRKAGRLVAGSTGDGKIEQ